MEDVMDGCPPGRIPDLGFAANVVCRRWPAIAVAAVLLATVLVFADGSIGHANGNGIPAGRGAAAAPTPGHEVRQAPAGLGPVRAIAAGNSHSLALRTDGTVYAWGFNEMGQLGNGESGTHTPTPMLVCAVGETAPCTRFLTGVIAVAAGYYHSLAVLSDRTVVAWGFNFHGQLGDGTTTNRLTPVRVCAVGQVAPCSRFLRGVRSIATHFNHNVAQLADTTAVTWGLNSGALGDGTTVDRSVPVRVCAVGQVAPCTRLLTGVRSVSAGLSHSLAVVDKARLVAWGANHSGQLGDGTTTNRLTPVRVCAVGQVAPCDRPLPGVRAVSGGSSHTLAVLGDGSVGAWGSNISGPLGIGTFGGYRSTPVRVCAVGEAAPCARFLTGVRSISGGSSHSLAQLRDGGVLAWGYGRSGDLGGGILENRATPGRVCAVGQSYPCTAYLSRIRAVEAGAHFNLALQPDYTVIAWGYNGDGQLGTGPDGYHQSTPVLVIAPRSAVRS
ncbi:cell wall anchor protein [Solwaraspora sp. WMMD406]|uniref:RCC1 domain-containing protein n=1 Tax=Solwaraspora sp. WMMD406 TaxID=3016095 RepID=UPI00241759FE|nr:cell wall anchor protein [Solwaraspora sp. WMMD406]MDG4762800.1 cell wall anchor protein [Solwaraspora sp. WMMD406]